MSFDAFAEGIRRVTGNPSEATDFAVERAGASFRVRLIRGSSNSALFSGRYVGRAPVPGDAPAGYREVEGRVRGPRPLKIALRKEGALDRSAKKEGVTVEAQTGDAAFDARVFIDTPSRPEVVRAVLASDALRRAVITLLDWGFASIELDADGFLVTASIYSFDRVGTDYERVVEAFATILREVPAIEAEGKHAADPARTALGVAILASVVGICPTVGALDLGTPRHCLEDGEDGAAIDCSEDAACCAPSSLACCGGAFVGVLVMMLLVRRVRGRSNSHTTRNYFFLCALFLGAEIGVILVNLLRP